VTGVGRNLEGPHRQRQFDGGQPHAQVRNIAEVATAIAGGDLSRKITVDVRGEILQLKETLNTMVDQLNRFAGGGDARGARVGHRRPPRRSGQRAGRRRHLETDLTDKRQLDGGQPHRARSATSPKWTTAVARGDLSRRSPSTVKAKSSN